MKLFRKIDKKVKDMEDWHFKNTVFVGCLLVLGGFLYQIFGTLLIMIESNYK